MENSLIKKKNGIFRSILNNIKNLFKKNKVEKEFVVSKEKNNLLKEKELSYVELEELQYELETGRVEKEDLSEQELKQVLEFYDTQIKDIRYENYKKISEINRINAKLNS